MVITSAGKDTGELILRGSFGCEYQKPCKHIHALIHKFYLEGFPEKITKQKQIYTQV